MATERGPVVLALFQGWGWRAARLGNVIAEAETPNFDQLWEAYPHALVDTVGRAVGLADGMVGSAAAGYTTLACGRPVAQAAAVLDAALADGSFFERPALAALSAAVRDQGRRLHLLGLVSDGQVVSCERHYHALLTLLQAAGVPGERVFVHAVLDGYDTPARSGMNYLARFAAEMRRTGIGRVATLMGRLYGLLPLGGWEATERAYSALVHGAGRLVPSAIQALQAGYSRGEDDLTLSPSVVLGADGLPLGRLCDGDILLCFNHREEGLERLLEALAAPTFHAFERGTPPALELVTLSDYPLAGGWGARAAFIAPAAEVSLGAVAAAAGRGVGMVAESSIAERTAFMARGAAADAVRLVALPSPSLEAVIEQPERLTAAITAQVVAWLEGGETDLIVADYFNADLAGHLGHAESARLAVEALDATLSPLVRAARKAGATVLVTACFGNVEELAEADSARPNPAHTTHPVPLLLIADRLKGLGVPDTLEVTLADVGVTVAALLGIAVPGATGLDLMAVLRSSPEPRAAEEGPASLEIAGLEALGMIILAGRDALRYYTAASERATDAEGAAVYRALGRGEERRMHALERRYELLSGGEACAERPDPWRDTAPPTDLSPLAVLDAAIEEEWATYRMLTEIATRNVDPEGTTVLEQLASEELEVLGRLQRLSEAEALRLLSVAPT